ncbi:MAG: hypothetical protein UW91_C0062G0002 [Parcubacteria group bacterium GW2011_GWF2_45_11]|nr:MAG: hypothetical protein UW91_C0062G0002 [Parcubacteria group bacterium GW2011_GWF2_45_11]
MKKNSKKVKPFSKSELSSFAKKLEKWGESLPVKEQPLLQLILGRARSIEPEDVKILQLKDNLKEAVLSVFKKFATDGGIWVKIGPISWLKRTPQRQGEDIEITHRISTKKR